VDRGGLRRSTGATEVGAVAKKLRSIVARVFGIRVKDVEPGLGPGDVERWDSLGHLTLVAAVEREFSIRFDEDEILEFTSIQAILSTVERKVGVEGPTTGPTREAEGVV